MVHIQALPLPAAETRLILNIARRLTVCSAIMREPTATHILHKEIWAAQVVAVHPTRVPRFVVPTVVAK